MTTTPVAASTRRVRQVVHLHFDRVPTSCGNGTQPFDYRRIAVSIDRSPTGLDANL